MPKVSTAYVDVQHSIRLINVKLRSKPMGIMFNTLLESARATSADDPVIVEVFETREGQVGHLCVASGDVLTAVNDLPVYGMTNAEVDKVLRRCGCAAENTHCLGGCPVVER